MLVRLRRVMSQFSVASLALVAAVSVAHPAATSAVAPEVRQAPITTVTVKASGCQGCRIGPFNFRTQTAVGMGTAITNGVAVLRVETSLTRGMGFFITNSAPNANSDTNWLAVTRYKGKNPGNGVTERSAANAKYATQCWAGTDRRKVTLRLTVRHFTISDNFGNPTDVARAYFSPTLRTIGKPWETVDGALATQSVLDCSGESLPMR